MFSLVSRLGSAAANVTCYVAERTIQTSCSLLITASRACDYAQSFFPAYALEFWTIGQGAIMTVCGAVTVARATQSHAPRKWRYPVMTIGACFVGVGIYAIVESVGRLWTGVPNVSFASKHLVRLDLNSQSASTARHPVCLIKDAPHTFEQVCKPQGHKSVFVMCHVANGAGDIGHCKKIFNFLEDSFPQHQVEIGLPVNVRPDLERCFPKAFSDQALFFSNYSKITTRQDDLVVDCPLLVYQPEVESIIHTIANNSTPHLGVTEFDYCPVISDLNFAMKKKNHTQSLFFSSGLGADSIGLPFDTARYKAAAATSFNELRRLENLCTLSSPGLRRAILDDSSCSQETLTRFHKKYSLYPSYTHYGVAKDAFFTTILKVSKLLNETREPCFVFVGSALSPLSTPLINIPTEERRIFRDMRYLGFNHIDLLFSSREKPDAFLSHEFTFSTKSNMPQSIRMVTLPYTSNQNFMALIGAGRIGQATGDQSAAEMFEAHLPFIYELLHHKTAFATAAAERAKQFDPELGGNMQDLMTIFNERLTDISWRWDTLINYDVAEEAWPDDSTTKAARALVRLMKKPATWNGFIKHLFEHHNELPKIREVVKGYLSHAQQA